MENKLKQLFGYQRFEENRELQQVIDSVHAKYAKRELALDDLEMVLHQQPEAAGPCVQYV